METIKDIWASLIRGVDERGANPLTFSFLLSWAVWNFKFFVVLFGDGTSAERISSIESMYSDNWGSFWGRGFAYPAISALAYVFIYPFVSEFAIEFYRRRQVGIINKIKKIEGEKLLSREDAARLQIRHEAERTEWNKKEEELERLVERLRDALKVKEKASEGPEVAAENLEPEVTSTQPPNSSETEDKKTRIRGKFKHPLGGENAKILTSKLLLHLSELPNGADAAEVSESFGVNYSVIREMLEEMKEQQVVTRGTSGRWHLTSGGRKAAVRLLESIESRTQNE